ncbi:MAG: hypothetical protein HOP33_04585 [Verrucomicrobia bacterium]|nr:hypothetical protein [Verrucomicrobiota bacterium]
MTRFKKFTVVAWSLVCVCTSLAVLLGSGRVQAASQPGSFMPRAEDFTLLWWASGPQKFHGMKTPPPEAVLCFQSGTLGLALDTKTVRLLHAGRFARTQNVEEALRPGNDAILALPPVALELSVRQGGRKFSCIGRGELPKDDFYFPVRFIESGRFLQRVAIEGLEFADSAGERFEAKGWLEIALWPDRVVLLFNLEATNAWTSGELELVAGGRRVSQPLNTRQPVVLELFGSKNPARPIIETDGALQLKQGEETGCTVLELPRHKWQNAKGTYYPEEELDRLDRWRFTVRNDSEREATLPIMFVDEHPPAITGFTPMLCDSDGTPTGIPVQISKNWHTRPEKGVLRHQGPWFHGCTFVRLPPRSRREFNFTMAYARYGGVPAASHAQLSLIGWGHNQFWDQSAIGSFGESICYEPGRVQRRCSIDDVRPLMTLPNAEAKPYGWAGNGGGGDFLAWIDEAGRYQGFRGTRCDYRAYGPCLTDVGYIEETLGGELTSRVKVSIARSDDYLRAFHHLRYDVRRPMKWQRLAFYQLGADFYNDTPARSVAIGDAKGLREEWQPIQAKDRYDRSAVVLAGEQSWISIHGVERKAVNQGGTVASRGLIVRSWQAVLGGKPCPQPHASFFATEWGKGNFRTVIELSPPPGLTELKPGDFVEAEVELVMFPADARAYYGPNAAFRTVLETDADTWRLVQREAAGNALQVRTTAGKVIRNYPLAMTVDRRGRAACTLAGGIGYVPVTFSGLGDYRDFELLVDGQPLNQAVHGKDFWQTDYDASRKQWQVTYNVLRDGSGPSRLELRHSKSTQDE